jgi:hypothetical protein
MRPTLDETDILEYPSPASQGDESHESSRWERSCFLALLRRLFTPGPRLRTRRQDHCHPGARRVETPLDMLAREHPDVFLLVIGGMG